MKLLIRNLARTTTESQLLELFKPFGEVRACTLVNDQLTGESKGFGFVEMSKSGPANIAMKSLNNIELDGNRIRVKRATVGSSAPAETHADTATGHRRRD